MTQEEQGAGRRLSRLIVCSKQKGAALLVLVALIVVGSVYFLVHSLNRASFATGRERATAQALAEAKEALIGYAVKDATRPGELPCPDIDDDGQLVMNVDYVGSNCVSYLGRLPWKTLGLPDLRDGNGERLWYAVSTAFHANGSTALNSDTLGTLTVYAADGSTLLTPSGYSAVAVVFAPGAPLAGQERDTVATACATTGTTMERRLCAANYLDTANGRNNATTAGPYIAGAPAETFNDRLLHLGTRELMPVVEQRVARELITALNSFYANYGFYPWADFNTYAYGNPSYDYDANAGLNKGKLPRTLTYDASQSTFWQNALPAWFINNRWYDMIYYAAGRNATPDPGSCTFCWGSWLEVNGASIFHVVFFMPGTPTTTRPSSDWRAYLQDAENHDNDTDGDGYGGGGPVNDRYVTPTNTAMDRNRIYYRDTSLAWYSR